MTDPIEAPARAIRELWPEDGSIVQVCDLLASEADTLARAAITAYLSAQKEVGWVLVPVAITPHMAVALESNFAECLPASEVHAANWQIAWADALTAAPDPLANKEA